MRAAVRIRSASFHSPLIGSPSDSSSSLHRSRSIGFSPIRSALHLDIKTWPAPPAPKPLRRARSDTDLVVPDRIGARWSPPTTLEEKKEEEMEMEFAGGGIGKGKKIGGGGDGGNDQSDDSRRIGSYYQEMLRSDPSNPLLLRNYGRFLHEVEGDVEGAEECYGRAVLASPGDGDVLSLYGKLVWEAHRDEERASSYFERAVEASPDDCYVLGSYASFLWDADEEEEETQSQPLVEAF